MHYIRFLKTPRLAPSSVSSLTAKVTITTDLGESFLMTDIQLIAELELNEKIIPGTSKEYTWKGANGMRALEVQIPIPTRRGAKFDGLVKMVIKPKDHAYTMNTFEDVLTSGGEDSAGVVTLRSMGINLSSKESTAMSIAERVFITQQPSSTTTIRIYEETGESIARHICRSLLPGTCFHSCFD
jgi:hypothetical protein